MLTGKAFEPGYVQRLVCFLGLIVSGVKEIEQKVARKKLKMAIGFKRFRGEKGPF